MLGALLLSGVAEAQSLTPMRGKVYTDQEEFAVRVYPRNVYGKSIDLEVKVYDEQFRPVRAEVWPAHFSLAAGGTRPVTVLVGFEGLALRKVRICAESVPFPEQQTQIKARVCGRFLAYRS